MTDIRFMDVLRLEVEVPTEGLPNLVPNPSGDKGAWGWETPVPYSLLFADGDRLKFAALAGEAYWTSELLKVSAGRWVSSRITIETIDIGLRIRIRYEWYDAAKAYLSSSVQTSPVTTVAGPTYGPTVQAPAGTAFARLRVDVYDAMGGNPTSLVELTFRDAMVTHTDTGTPTQVRANLVTNPSFELPAGWLGSTGVSRTSGGAHRGTYKLTSSGNGNAATSVDVAGGRDYWLLWHVRADQAGAYQTYPRIEWRTADDRSAGTLTANLQAVGTSWASRSAGRFTAPSTATRMVVQINFTRTSGGTGNAYLDSVLVSEGPDRPSYFDGDTADHTGVTYAWEGSPHASVSTRTVAGGAAFDFEAPHDWRNILGPSHEIRITREALNVGTLEAVILDAELDPATVALIRPGKKVRLLSYFLGDWHSVYEGALTEARTAYRKAKGRSLSDPGAVRVEITAADNVAHLANQGEARTVAVIDELPALLEGKGVPWSVNGYGGHVSASTVVATNPAASALDQVSITRDTVLGHVWVDRSNVLQAWDAALFGNTPVFTFSDDPAAIHSYTDVDVSYDVADCMNVVRVNFLRYKPVAGETEEVPYGPYSNQVSVDEHGAREATFTIAGLVEDEATVQSYAQQVLDANSVPVVRCNSLTMPVRSEAELGAATWIDLHTPVGVVYADRVDDVLRVTSISHTITPGKWLVEYGFARPDAVAPPSWTPPVPARVDALQLLSLAAAGWSWSLVELQRLPGGLWSLAGTVTRTGAAITAGAAGDITDVVLANSGSLPAGCHPTGDTNSVYFPAFRGFAATWWVRITPGGGLALTHGTPTAVIGTGQTLAIRALWHHSS